MRSGVWLQKAQDEVGPECTVAYFSMFSDEAKCWSNASTYGIYGKCPPHSFTGFHMYFICVSYFDTILDSVKTSTAPARADCRAS
jgi:hypothetical protein